MRAPLLGLLSSMVVMTGACGAIIDSTYWLGDGKTSTVVPATAATGEAETRIEYEATQDASLSMQLNCYRRTRGVERAWDVTKTYEYRGGYEKGAYSAAIIMDGIFGALVAGTITAICLQDDSDVSCANTAWAAPFAIDLVYSVIRHANARPKVLVNKRQGSDHMQYGQAAQEEQTQCQSVAALYLGGSTGPSNAARLNGFAGGEARALGEGALPLAFDEAGAILFSGEQLSFWATNNSVSLWVQDDRGELQTVLVDRCAAIRPQQQLLTIDAKQSFTRDCPLPQPPQ